MTIPEIIRELEPYTGRFPKAAMRAAVDQREHITPELLRVLEAVADDPTAFAARQDYMLPTFALFLLAQFREQRAYSSVVRMVRAPGETPFDLVGDTVTEALSQILASVYDGDPLPLHGLVESEEVNEYVRGAAVETFLVLEHTGLMPLTQVIDYFRGLFHGSLSHTHSNVWDSLVCAVADLRALELREEVRQAYAEGLADPSFADLQGLERDMVDPKPPRHDRHYLITDAIAEMEWWPDFHLEDFEAPKPTP